MEKRNWDTAKFRHGNIIDLLVFTSFTKKMSVHYTVRFVNINIDK